MLRDTLSASEQAVFARMAAATLSAHYCQLMLTLLPTSPHAPLDEPDISPMSTPAAPRAGAAAADGGPLPSPLADGRAASPAIAAGWHVSPRRRAPPP